MTSSYFVKLPCNISVVSVLYSPSSAHFTLIIITIFPIPLQYEFYTIVTKHGLTMTSEKIRKTKAVVHILGREIL